MIRDTVIHNSSSAVPYFSPFIPRDVVFVGQAVFLAIFLLLCFRLIHRAGREPHTAGYTSDHSRLRWLSFVLISFTASVLISNFYLRAIWMYSLVPIGRSVYLYVAPLTLLLVLLEVRAFLRPEVYTHERFAQKLVRKYRNSRLGELQEKAIIARLRSHMEQHKSYLDSELRISSLSEELNVPVNHLSQAINHQLQQNFFEFTNSYRVAEARRLMESPNAPDLNLLNIALETGFNNKTTFLNAFRKTLNMSPSGYRRLVKQHHSASP